MIVSFIGKKKPALRFFGLGVLLYAIVVFLLRFASLNNNVSLFVISIILSLVLLLWGAFK